MKPVCVGHLWFQSKLPNLGKPHGTMKMELCNDWLCKSTVQRAETAVQK